MRSPLIKAALALLIAGFAAIPARAATVYSTGFESPTFTTGQLAGQDGWGDQGNAPRVNVENTLANGGTQAVQFTATGSSGQMGAVHFDTINTGGSGIVSVSVDVRRANVDGTSSASADLSGFNGGSANIGNIRWAANNDLVVQGGSAVTTSGLLTRNTWFNFRMDFNFGTHTFNAFLNNSSVASNIAFSSTNNTFLAGGIFVQGPGTDNIFFDNYSVTTPASVPLPASVWGGLALGSLLALREARNRLRRANA